MRTHTSQYAKAYKAVNIAVAAEARTNELATRHTQLPRGVCVCVYRCKISTHANTWIQYTGMPYAKTYVNLYAKTYVNLYAKTYVNLERRGQMKWRRGGHSWRARAAPFPHPHPDIPPSQSVTTPPPAQAATC